MSKWVKVFCSARCKTKRKFCSLNAGDNVKRKTAEELAAATLEVFGAAFSTTPEWPDGRKVMEETAREVLIKRLLPIPEPTAKHKSELKQHVKNLRTVARTEFMKVARELPKNPGGRRKALTPEKVGQACQHMATLLYQGVEKSDARNRTAARFNVSPWTIGRYWREYQQSENRKK